MKADRYIFLDFEFNTAKKIQEIVSVGVVVCDLNFNVTSKYYSLVALNMTTSMDKYASKVNNITDEVLRDARDFKTVFLELNNTLKLTSNDKIFTWGYDDKRTFDYGIEHHSLESELFLMSNCMTNIQKELSSKVKYNGDTIGDTLALKYLKRICNIDGEVTHNALDDAIDLMDIYKKSINNEFNPEVVKEIYFKRKESRIQKESMNHLISRFSSTYPNGVSVNMLGGSLFKKTSILLALNNILYKNSFLFEKTKDSIVLRNLENHSLNIKKDVTYNNLKFNFNTKGKILIISIISNKNLHEFHINSKKHSGLVYSLLKQVENISKK